MSREEKDETEEAGEAGDVGDVGEAGEVGETLTYSPLLEQWIEKKVWKKKK